MANSHFRFKEFIVHQGNDMMKVCTDSCLFGAWAASHLAASPFKNLLDIGTGTGLLALMIAQKHRVKITAVEIADAALKQAQKNIEQSPFKERISLKHIDIQDVTQEKFDFILTNPPFYEHDLRSGNSAVNLARHNEGLTFEGLLLSVNRLLLPQGEFAVLLPAARKSEFVQLASKYGLCLYRETMVKQTGTHKPFRAMLWFGRKTRIPIYSEIVIRDIQNAYSPEFEELLRDYYLEF